MTTKDQKNKRTRIKGNGRVHHRPPWLCQTSRLRRWKVRMSRKWPQLKKRNFKRRQSYFWSKIHIYPLKIQKRAAIIKMRWVISKRMLPFMLSNKINSLSRTIFKSPRVSCSINLVWCLQWIIGIRNWIQNWLERFSRRIRWCHNWILLTSSL